MNFLPSYVNLHNYISLPSVSILQEVPEAQQLQNAISATCCHSIEEHCRRTPQLLKNPLPNGELPLHYAAKTSQNPEVLATLLKAGADPLQLDVDGLNAVECAKLAGNQAAFEAILRHCISQDLQVLENAELTAQARKVASQLRGLKYKDASPFFKAVVEKNENKVARLLSVNPDTAKQVAKNRDTLLHAAVISGSQKILELCLNDPKTVERVNVQNDQGLTALHYAAAFDRFDMIQQLVKHGGDIRIKDRSGVTPVALLGAAIERKNPLEITKSEMITCALSTLFWGTRLLLSGGSIRAGQAETVINALSTLSLCVSILPQLGSWKSMTRNNLAWLGLAIFEYNYPSHLLTMPLQAFRTGMLAKTAFEGIAACWRNVSFGKGKALVKAAIAHGPKIAAVCDTLGSVSQKIGLTNPPRYIAHLNAMKENKLRCKNAPMQTGNRHFCDVETENIFDLCGYSDWWCVQKQQNFDSLLRNIEKYKLSCKSDAGEWPNGEKCESDAERIYGACITKDPGCREEQRDFDNKMEKLAKITQLTQDSCKNLNESQCSSIKLDFSRKCDFRSVLSASCDKYFNLVKTLKENQNHCNIFPQEHGRTKCTQDAEAIFSRCRSYNEQECLKSNQAFVYTVIKHIAMNETLLYDCAPLSSDLSARCQNLKSAVKSCNIYSGTPLSKHCEDDYDQFRKFIREQEAENSKEAENSEESRDSKQSENFEQSRNFNWEEFYNFWNGFHASLRNENSRETCLDAIKTICSKSDCSVQEVKKQYKQQVLQNHPDKTSDPNAHEKIIKLNSLYETTKTEECLKYQKNK